VKTDLLPTKARFAFAYKLQSAFIKTASSRAKRFDEYIFILDN